MTGSFSDDPDERVDEIEEKIKRLRRLHGWTDGDTVQVTAMGEAEKAGAAKPPPIVLRWSEAGKAREVVIDQEHFEIGTGDKAQLRLMDPSLSPRHCRISAEDGGHRVRDLRSLTGTFVNGEKVPLSLPVKAGDTLTLGDVTFTVALKGAAPVPVAPTRALSRPEPEPEPDVDDDPDDGGWDSAKTVLHDVDDEPAPAPKPAPSGRPAPAAAPSADASSVWDDSPTILQRAPPPPSALRPPPPARPAPAPLARPPAPAPRPPAPAPAAAAPAPTPAAPARVAEAILRWSDADGNAREITVRPDQPVLVGRRPESGIRLNDGSVSSRHCVFEIEDGALILRDLGSTNGTFIDKVRVSRQVLNEGDEVFCGLTGLRVSLGAAADGSSAAARPAAAATPAAAAFHLVHMNDEGAMASTVVGGAQREVALGGSRFAWQDGLLHVTGRGMVVDGRQVDEARIERGHIKTRNGMRVHVVREAPRRARPPADVATVARWIKSLGIENADLEVLLIDPTSVGGRFELCMWGDGVVEVDVMRGGDKATQRGQVTPALVRVILTALASAGFPDALGHNEADAAAPEIHVSAGSDRAKVVVGPDLVQAIGSYGMARELLFGVACEVGELEDQITAS